MDDTNGSLSRPASGLGVPAGRSVGAPEGEEASVPGREATVACSCAPSWTPACAGRVRLGVGVLNRSRGVVVVQAGIGLRVWLGRSGCGLVAGGRWGRVAQAHPAQRSPHRPASCRGAPPPLPWDMLAQCVPRCGRTSPRVPSSPSARPLKSRRSSSTPEKASWQSTSRACARGRNSEPLQLWMGGRAARVCCSPVALGRRGAHARTLKPMTGSVSSTS